MHKGIQQKRQASPRARPRESKVIYKTSGTGVMRSPRGIYKSLGINKPNQPEFRKPSEGNKFGITTNMTKVFKAVNEVNKSDPKGYKFPTLSPKIIKSDMATQFPEITTAQKETSTNEPPLIITQFLKEAGGYEPLTKIPKLSTEIQELTQRVSKLEEMVAVKNEELNTRLESCLQEARDTTKITTMCNEINAKNLQNQNKQQALTNIFKNIKKAGTRIGMKNMKAAYENSFTDPTRAIEKKVSEVAFKMIIKQINKDIISIRDIQGKSNPG
ncbi:unnamed protein product [Moneuplotes crassus]|uniref:Uncharacterized protein n=1 Tax=Euplotes crassus TaxID=5936 RepID=A0AAD1UU52_EUPCR|nr:unnamed protein product [Moneuplotes crassus]